MAAAELAAACLRRRFCTNLRVSIKEDGGPVTLADREADQIIRSSLAGRRLGFPIISEEGAYEDLSATRDCVWVVDPLDGTSEFIADSPDFAVHIGLCVEGIPRLGVVAEPMAHRTYYGIVGEGAFCVSTAGRRPCEVSGSTRVMRAATSRRHPSARAAKILSRLGDPDVLAVGSSGLKAALVAQGKADLYVAATDRLGTWDAVAPEALVVAAGGVVSDLHGERLDYGASHRRMARGVVISNRQARPQIDAVLRPLD